MLYGRGAANMKTSIAAMDVAVEEFFAAYPHLALSIAFLIPIDEEYPDLDGTAMVCDRLLARGEVLDFSIVDEPISVNALGNMVKNGRCGTPSGKLTGSTSDSRFIAKFFPRAIEPGPVNATLHQINECVAVASLQSVKNICKGIFERHAGLT